MKTTSTKSQAKTINATRSAKVEPLCKPAANEPEFHPVTACFHDLPDAEFEALKADIKEHGQQQPIVTMNGKIIDGRQRLRACRELGIEPKFIEMKGNQTAEEAVISLNLIRRHLTESQRAMIGIRLVTTRLGSNQNTGESVSQQDAASLLGVSADSIQRAGKVEKAGFPALVKKVEAGKLTVHEAVQISKLPIKEIKGILAANDEQFRDRVKAARIKVRQMKIEAVQIELDAKRANNQPLETVAGQYGVLYIDPPWDYLPETDLGYPTLNREELLALPVAAKAAENAVCFLWSPASQLPLALEVMKAWGFEYKTHAVWDKESPGTGSYFHSRHELLLLGTKGTLPEVEPKCRHQSIIAEKRGQHSRKPKAAYVMIEQMYPGLSKVELFARGKARDGWAVWGNEAIPAPAIEPEAAATAKPVKTTRSRAKAAVANGGEFSKAA